MAAGVAQATKKSINLKGSVDIVTEFFQYGINSILYQRGVYPPETFTRVQKYGLTILVTADPELKTYLSEFLKQIREWLMEKTVQKIVVIISSVDSGEALERWQFDIECDEKVTKNSAPKEVNEQEINNGIMAVIRQITASVTFLPLLEGACSFNLKVYTDKDVEVPNHWGETGPSFIANSQEVRLRSFTTTIHKVDAMVAYKS